MSAEERQNLKDTLYYFRHEAAYMQIQGSKPRSLAYGMNDSPLGLLAWLLEKFQTWSDCGQGPPENSGISMDEILTNVSLYWFTQSIGSSFRLYYESLAIQP